MKTSNKLSFECDQNKKNNCGFGDVKFDGKLRKDTRVFNGSADTFKNFPGSLVYNTSLRPLILSYKNNTQLMFVHQLSDGYF